MSEDLEYMDPIPDPYTPESVVDAAIAAKVAEWEAERETCLAAGLQGMAFHWDRVIAAFRCNAPKVYGTLSQSPEFVLAAKGFGPALEEAGAVKQVLAILEKYTPLLSGILGVAI